MRCYTPPPICSYRGVETFVRKPLNICTALYIIQDRAGVCDNISKQQSRRCRIRFNGSGESAAFLFSFLDCVRLSLARHGPCPKDGSLRRPPGQAEGRAGLPLLPRPGLLYCGTLTSVSRKSTKRRTSRFAIRRGSARRRRSLRSL